VPTATERLSCEQAFHDRQAEERAEYYRRHADQLVFEDAQYLDHESWIRPAMSRLGDVRGLQVLDYGCGHGMAAVVLARAGALVTAFDLSAVYLAEAAARAGANQVTIRIVQSTGERLPFPDACFDRVWGNAILHHLDLEKAGRELHRVLRPGAHAVFCEPWGENPLLNWARQTLPYPGKQRTADERPLRRTDVRLLRRIFPKVEVRGFQLLSMVRRVLPPGPLVTALERCDTALLNRLPILQRFGRYVVLTLHR
jgi:ubiquinone/menaquinone biosynthesis C-methylase UbiE